METIMATFSIIYRKEIYTVTMNGSEESWYIFYEGEKVYEKPIHEGKYFPDLQIKAHSLLKDYLKKRK